MKISDLPDFPTIEQIKNALWKTGDVRGAAVMVGSGFSRHASLNDPSIPPPPLWNDFSNQMQQQLYPKGDAPSDPLRLAQEYKASLGEPGLDGLIQSLIQDEKWEPSDLHKTLLSMPWSDVLTTNWDTLLERTPLIETERTYDVVRSIEDISRTSAPRIVKLHGSFPANRPFIFTEEDFRTYPRRFAPFVNLAQQVILENELCLIGFSGEDPNFLQWAGWVRDNLGSASRHIRLVGVLNLSPSRREMLKQQNVTPVDLSPLVENLQNDVKHSKAIAIFLNWLAASKPIDNHIWNRPSKEAFSSSSTLGSAQPSLHDLSEAWKNDRMNHPAWLVTPGGTQRSLRHETSRHYPSQAILSEDVDTEEKMRFLFELTYRHKVAFWPLSAVYAKIIQVSYSNGGEKHLLQSEQTQLCSFMLAEARRTWNWQSFDFWASSLEQTLDPSATVELLYEKALRAKQELDLVTLHEIVNAISGDDPVWKLRQGMLYTFLHKDKKAAECFRSALQEIRDRRAKDKQSIWLLSREAWAAWVFQSAKFELREKIGEYAHKFSDWPTRYAQKKCDPWSYTEFTQRVTADALAKSLDRGEITTPLFDPGHYRDNSASVTYVSHTEVSSFDLITRLQETVGLPSRIGNVNLLSTQFERAFTSLNRTGESDFFNAASIVANYDKGLMEVAFNRIEIAKIPKDAVSRLATALRKATEYYLSNSEKDDRKNRAIDRIRINIEIISRLCVRESPENAQLYFLWAVELCGRDSANDWWLYKHIGNVLKRCVKSLPKNQRKNIAETAIFLPLPGERNATGIAKDWPELIDEFEAADFLRPENSTKWASRIEELIQVVGNGSDLDRDRAILRLRALFKNKQLIRVESEKFAQAIWSKLDEENGWPATESLYPFVFLELPEFQTDQAIALFMSNCVAKAAEGTIDADLAHTITGGLKTSSDLVRAAEKYFPGIVSACINWQPQIPRSDFSISNTEYENRADEEAITALLSVSLLPEINALQITAETKALWHSILNNSNHKYIVGTAFEYARLFPQENDAMVHLIRKALYGKDKDRISYGNFAIQQYIKAHKQGTQQLPKILVSAVISICESLRVLSLHQSLYTAARLVEANVVENHELLRLSEVVDIIWSEFTYDSELLNKENMVTWTLIRSECVKLANTLLQAGQKTNSNESICSEAVEDPIPEVRFAIEVS